MGEDRWQARTFRIAVPRWSPPVSLRPRHRNSVGVRIDDRRLDCRDNGEHQDTRLYPV